MIDRPERDTRPLTFEELRGVLNVTLRAGQLLLQHGADVYRVEETILHMGAALGVSTMHVYVTPTGIIASVRSGDEQRTAVRRVTSGAVDLSRIDAVNQLSRRIGQQRLSVAEIERDLKRIASQPPVYNRLLTTVTLGLACGCFALLFGGGWREFVAATCGAALALVTRQELAKLGVGPLLQITPASAVGTLVVVLLAWLIGDTRLDVSVPGSVLPFVPGIPLINALSDLLANDFVSGVTRAAQTLLIAAEIAIGVALALDIVRWIGWIS